MNSQLVTNPLKPISLIVKSEQGVKVSDAPGKNNVEAIQYIIALLGISKERMPTAIEMGLILIYLKNHLGEFTVDELKLSFDLAVKKSFVVNLELYGGTLSVKFISDVLSAYKSYKKTEKEKLLPKPIGMNNVERLNAIVEIISKNEEAFENLKQIGSTEKKTKQDLPPLPYQDLHQKWFKQFDKLRFDDRFVAYFKNEETKQWHPNDRFIKRYGKILDVQGYFEVKAEQLIKIKNERLKYNKLI